MLGVAAAVGLVVAGLVAAGNGRRSKRYRPGRPFGFTPVWFLAAPAHQARAGHVTPPGSGSARGAGVVGSARGAGPIGSGVGRALERRSAVERASGPRQTGGASDRW